MATKPVVKQKSHELERTIRALSKEATKAVNKLAALCDSQDEKIALDASTRLLTALKDMSASARKDELQQILLDHKIKGMQNPQIEDNRPIIDFNTIN